MPDVVQPWAALSRPNAGRRSAEAGSIASHTGRRSAVPGSVSALGGCIASLAGCSGAGQGWGWISPRLGPGSPGLRSALGLLRRARLVLGVELLERGRELGLLVLARVRHAGLHPVRGCFPLLRRQEPHLALQRQEVRVGAVAPFELLDLVREAVARIPLGELRPRLGLRLHLIDLRRHPVERLERALIAQAAHRVLDGALRLGALLPRDEHVLLSLRLLDLVVQEAQRLLQLLDGGVLLRPLVLLGGRQLVVLPLARESLLRERLVSRPQGQHRPALPFLPRPHLLLHLLLHPLP